MIIHQDAEDSNVSETLRKCPKSAVLVQVTAGNHLLGVTSQGHLVPRGLASLSAEERKTYGFLAAAAAFVLMQCIMITVTRLPFRRQVGLAACVEWNEYGE